MRAVRLGSSLVRRSAPQVQFAARAVLARSASLSAPFIRAFSESSHSDFEPIRKAPPQPQSYEEIKKQIEEDISSHKVFLYMKGTPEFPQCGFSRQVAMILGNLGIEYGSRNVLENIDIREGIKRFSDWPTIPQLYIGGEFVGGCDIVTSMFNSGDLQTTLEQAGVKPLMTIPLQKE